MKNFLRKKRFLFPTVFVVQILIVIVIANVFSLETHNSLLGSIYAVVMVATIICFLVKIIKDHKTALTDIKIPFVEISVIWIFYLAIFTIASVSIIVFLTVLFGNA